MTYQTLVFPTRWTCNCPAPHLPDPSARMSPDEVEAEAANHVEYYRATWPHELVRPKR